MNRDEVTTLTSVLWPDTSIFDLGAFAETSAKLSADDTVKFGARLDTVQVAADAVNQQYGTGMMTSSPNMLYRKYYGVEFADTTESNPSGLLQYTRALTPALAAFAAVSYVSRTADATERSIASEGMSGNWIGNPSLDPEHHREVRAGLQWADDETSAEIAGYYNSVDDYIFRDTAREQDGILMSDGASVYRNIGATLSGFDAILHAPIVNAVSLVSSLSYTYGENRSTGKALPQIPPLSGWSAIEYSGEPVTLGLKVHYAMRQNRVDDNPETGSGRDVGKTGGYGTFDLYGDYEIRRGVRLQAGVLNLFDKTYANHLNRANAFDPVEVQVNEPGRSFYMGLNFTL